MMDYRDMIDSAEANIRADYRRGSISKEQFKKELLVVETARYQVNFLPSSLLSQTKGK